MAPCADPRRLRIDDRLDASAVAALVDEAARGGFVDVGMTGARLTATASIEPDCPELTAALDGWYWSPGGQEPLAPATAALDDVKRLVIERILTRAQAEGALPRGYSCVTVEP